MKRQHFKLVKNYGLRLKFPASVLYWQYGINETNIENNYQFEHYQIFDKSNVLDHSEFVRTIRTLDKMFRKKDFRWFVFGSKPSRCQVSFHCGKTKVHKTWPIYFPFTQKQIQIQIYVLTDTDNKFYKHWAVNIIGCW